MVELNGTRTDPLFLLVPTLAEICPRTPFLFFDRTAIRSPSPSSCRFIHIRPQSGQQSTAQTNKESNNCSPSPQIPDRIPS